MFVGSANRLSCATKDDDHYYAHIEVVAIFVLLFRIVGTDNSFPLFNRRKIISLHSRFAGLSYRWFGLCQIGYISIWVNFLAEITWQPLLASACRQRHFYTHIQRLGGYLRLKLYQNTEFDGIRRGPPKSESVDCYLFLGPDPKVSYVGSNGPHHCNLHLTFYL